MKHLLKCIFLRDAYYSMKRNMLYTYVQYIVNFKEAFKSSYFDFENPDLIQNFYILFTIKILSTYDFTH